ncbi:MAG: benzoylsuccinyl-CoA thiolase, partial [Halieaceae bacterium]|nr:benzoylsuccinyl-CoA thiolase [Halieaceae bacterium]
PAIEGWHTMTADPHLIGTQCAECGTYFFPKHNHFCKNPGCQSTDFKEVELSRTGTIWSYTNACYKPPAPYVPADPFEPYALAAVELEKEQMTVLGQVATGVSVEDLKVGMTVELVLEQLHETEDEIKVTWKWRPIPA